MARRESFTSWRSSPDLDLLEDRVTPAYLQAGGANIAVGDLLVGGGNEIIEAPGRGGGPVITIYNPAGQKLQAFPAFDLGARYGVQVAAGDVDGNGSAEIIATPGPGGGPIVRVFDFFGNEVSSFLAFDPNFRGGLQVATADVNGDGAQEILVTPGPNSGGGPVVQVYTYTGQLINQFFVYDESFRGGLTIAGGDMNADGLDEVVVGTGPGGGPVVGIFNGVTGGLISQFFAFEPTSRRGINVAVGDTDFGGAEEVYVTQLPVPNAPPVIRGFLINGFKIAEYEGDFDPINYSGGLNIAVGDANIDGIDDILAVRATGAFDQAPAVAPGSRLGFAQGIGFTAPQGIYSEDDNFIYYFPSGFTEFRRYPIVFAFSGDGDVTLDPTTGRYGPYDQQLKQAADRLGFIVATSKYFRESGLYGQLRDGGTLDFTYDNAGNTYIGSGYFSQRNQINETLAKFTNVDQTRVLLLGYAQGGSFAHAMNLLFPGLADAIFVDDGPVWGPLITNPVTQYGPNIYGYATQFTAQLGAAQSAAGSRKDDLQIARLGSQFFDEVNRDFFQLYTNLGWSPFAVAPQVSGFPLGSPLPSYLPDLTQLFFRPTFRSPPPLGVY